MILPCRNFKASAIIKTLCLVIAWQINPLFLLLSKAQMEDQEKPSVIRVAFTKGMFFDKHPNDAKAAIKVWTESVADAKNINAIADPRIFDDFDHLQEAFGKAEVDLVALRIDEYFNLSLTKPLEFIYLGNRNGQPEDSALLLCQQSISNIAQLQNGRLNVYAHASSGMSLRWLNTILLENSLSESDRFFSDIKEVTKTSQAILPVFFGSKEACLVTEDAFNAMVELNPQIGKKLKILLRSPEFVSAVMFLHPSYNPPYKEDILEALDTLHLNAKGQQVLMLFKTDKLVRCQDRDLQQTKDIFNRYFDAKRKMSARGFNGNLWSK